METITFPIPRHLKFRSKMHGLCINQLTANRSPHVVDSFHYVYLPLIGTFLGIERCGVELITYVSYHFTLLCSLRFNKKKKSWRTKLWDRPSKTTYLRSFCWHHPTQKLLRYIFHHIGNLNALLHRPHLILIVLLLLLLLLLLLGTNYKCTGIQHTGNQSQHPERKWISHLIWFNV